MALDLDDKKKKTLVVIIIAFGLAVMLLLLAWLLTMKPSTTKDGAGEADKPVNAISEVPDAEETASRTDKRSIYRSQKNSTIEDYWDSLEGEGSSSPADDVGSEPMQQSATSSGRKDEPRVYTTQSIFEDLQRAEAASGGTSDAERHYRERMARQEENARQSAASRERLVKQLMERGNGGDGTEGAPAVQPTGSPEQELQARDQAQAAEQDTEVPLDTLPSKQVQVRRTGSVTTLDDGFISSELSGVSSLDGGDDIYSAEEKYPFKCMFVRDEKLKSGMRVAVRLLEDMVIDGQLIPKNTHLQATCSINQRLELSVKTLDVGGRLIAFDYEAYDNDGGKGLYYPEAKTDGKTQQATSQLGQTAFSRASSNAGRMAQDVLNVGRILVTGSGKETTVSVPAGYQFYLVKKTR